MIEKFFEILLQERAAELANLKQSKNDKCFAWMACYAVSKPAIFMWKNDLPRLEIRFDEFTKEVQRNLPLVWHNNCLKMCIVLTMPKTEMSRRLDVNFIYNVTY